MDGIAVNWDAMRTGSKAVMTTRGRAEACKRGRERGAMHPEIIQIRVKPKPREPSPTIGIPQATRRAAMQTAAAAAQATTADVVRKASVDQLAGSYQLVSRSAQE